MGYIIIQTWEKLAGMILPLKFLGSSKRLFVLFRFQQVPIPQQLKGQHIAKNNIWEYNSIVETKDNMIDNKGLVLCLTPVYNDWESLNELVDEIRGVFSESADKKFKILVIDDGSTEQNNHLFDKKEVEIISLKKNVGHQRAIAIGIQ